ncbi:N-acyl-aliphatic-L-amino acid amidohydrolase [Nesidiocoris tenuis]|uniref:N-acyl-aliphatic-L-amino acid amidohydrolase n=1 Tax=Nesidiocoris tenuis TaxID=355587 RepID=A0ABN7B729_9HEMI|nr:N-acyl-aliphatic-L-amino acid amidohydrolase [Nesidiocoris tenuis]
MKDLCPQIMEIHLKIEDIHGKVEEVIEEEKESAMAEHESVALLREYLRIPSVHPDIDYEPCVNFLEKQAAIWNLPVSIYGLEKKPVVIITWKGKNPNLSAILLNSHMDVVPVVKEKWTYDPFEAHKTDDGKIYARGAQDMKSIGIQYLEAVKRLIKQGFQPKRTVILSFVPEEEVGGVQGMMDFAETEEFRKLNIGFSLDEGIPSNSDHFIIYNNERAKWGLRIHCRGPAGHGSILHQNTAAEKMSVVLKEIYARRAKESQKIEGHPEPMAVMGDVTTFNLTLAKGGVQNNVVPDHLIMEFDIRLAVTEDPNELLLWLQNVCKSAGEGTTLEFMRKSPQIPPTPVDERNPFWEPYSRTLKKLGHEYVIGTFSGGTDSRFLRRHGIPAYGLTPLKNTPVLLHDHDEYIPEDQFLEGIDLYVELIKALTEVEDEPKK